MQGSIGGKNIYGQVNNPVTTVEYKGGITDTADVSIDNKKKEITADVKKLPNDLIVEDRTGDEVKEIRFNGDGERTVVLKDWTLREVEPETGSNVLEYSLIKDGEETGDRIIAPKLERCLYKSETNASKWESKEGSLIGYLGTSDEETLKASVGLQLKAANVFMPTYPVVSGTYYSPMDNSNALTGELNLTPFNSATSPLLSFSGTGSLSMGTRSIYLDSGWFNTNTSSVNLKIPAVSGTLITEADALGSIDIEVEDLDATSVLLTDDQYNALAKYPKALLAFKSVYGGDCRYFTKLEDFTSPAGVKYITSVKSDNGLKVGIATSSFNYDKVSYQLDIVYTELADIDSLITIQKINYGFYPTVDSDNNVTVKSYEYLTESEVETLKKSVGSYVITDDGYPAFVKSIDESTILIEDLGVCTAELNRTLPQNKRAERIALECTTVENKAMRTRVRPQYGSTGTYEISAITFSQQDNAPIPVFDKIFLRLKNYTNYGFSSCTEDTYSYIHDLTLAKNYYFYDVGSSSSDTSFTIKSSDKRFTVSGDVNAEGKRAVYWFIPGDDGVGRYIETLLTSGSDSYTFLMEWTGELASLIADDIDTTQPLTWYQYPPFYPYVSYVKKDGTTKKFQVSETRWSIGKMTFNYFQVPSELEGGKTLTLIFSTTYENQNTVIKYTSLLGKVTQSGNYKLEQNIVDLQTSLSDEATARDDADRELQQNIDTEQARAQREENDIRANLSEEIANRESEVLELQEECSNITQGIQEFSNSVDIRFQEKEEEITKNSDSISALSNKEASDVSGLQASIDQEVSDRKTAVSELKKTTVAIQDYSAAGSEITPYAWSYYAGCGWVIDQGSTYNKFTIEANEIYTAVYITTNGSTHITLPNAFSGNHIVAYQEDIDALKNDSITPLEERISAIEERFDGSSLASLSFYYDDEEPK